jgi:hypothetical protein
MKDDLTPFCHKIRETFVTLAFQDKENIHTTSTNTQLSDVFYEIKHEKCSSVILYQLPKLIQINLMKCLKIPKG